MIERLHPKVKLLAMQAAPSSDEISMVAGRYPRMPKDYFDFVREAADGEFELDGDYVLRIWRPSGVIEMDDAYGISQQIRGALPIGDDEGGRVVYYADGPSGFGVYASGYGDLDLGDAKWIAPSLASILIHGEGIENFAR